MPRPERHLNNKNINIITKPPRVQMKFKSLKFSRNWVSATAGRNYLMRTPIDDLFKAINTKTTANQNNILFQRGHEFEAIFINYIRQKYKADFIEIISQSGEVRPDLSVEFNFRTDKFGRIHPAEGSYSAATFAAIKQGKGIIYSGFLLNPVDRTFGIPDLIIKGRLIKSIFKEWCNQFKNTIKIHDNRYYIIDIKYKTLAVKVDGFSLRNDGSNKAYKSQVYIYNEALKAANTAANNIAFLLGRISKSSSEATNEKLKSIFNKVERADFEYKNMINMFGALAVIDCRDDEVASKTAESVNWVRRLRLNSKKWGGIINGILKSGRNYPARKKLPAAELYPNGAALGGIWSKEKRRLGELLGEISMIWRINAAARSAAHQQGVYSSRDDRFLNNILPIIGSKNDNIYSIQRTMLTSGEMVSLSSEAKEYISPRPNTVDLFVDFEGISTALLPLNFAAINTSSYDNFINNQSMITMIGVVNVAYKDFTAAKISSNSEEDICRNFIKYLSLIPSSKIRIWHWSPAEPSSWKRVCEKYNLTMPEGAVWCDLYKLFIEEKLVISGATSFSLKEVTAALIKTGRIDKKYGYGSSTLINSGLSAMFSLIKYYTGEGEPNLLEEIKNYNKIDCMILAKILEWLRGLED